MTNKEYILQHLTGDVRQLALRSTPDGVDPIWCLQQIEGYQLARKKLPSWADLIDRVTQCAVCSHDIDDDLLWFPPRLSMEQCSSQTTADYKRLVLERLLSERRFSAKDSLFADLTGGFGIDFSYLAHDFGHSVYIEHLEHLCDIARHNLPILGLKGAQVINGEAADVLAALTSESIQTLKSDACGRVFFLDPARRDDAGRKVVALEDCTPNVIEMQDELLSKSDILMLKLSPMLDITQAVRQLNNVREVHVVSVKGECKEVLLVLSANMPDIAEPAQSSIKYYCVNLETTHDPVVCDSKERRNPAAIHQGGLPSMMMLEPNASLLKAGFQDVLCHQYGMQKLHPLSNLFVCEQHLAGLDVSRLPGRAFVIEEVSDFSKPAIRRLLSGLKQANIAVRNFPASVAELRKRFKLNEGGDVYIYVTTLCDGSHAILRCRRLAY